MTEKGKPLVYIVSDSTGETAEFVVRAVASQFNSHQVELRREPFMTSLKRLRKVVRKVAERKGMIAYTLVLPQLRQAIVEEAQKYKLPVVDLMGPLLDSFSKILPKDPRLEPGLIRRMDEDYFRRVKAVEFAVKHDDGKDPRGLALADVVLIGVSRTSKTPLSMYLAGRQLQVANLPLVPEVEPPPDLFLLPSRKVIGLTIDPLILREIRRERLNTLGLKAQADYADLERIMDEQDYSCRIMRRLQCRIFDVTNKAVEEVASKILNVVKEAKEIEQG
ncbi:MAG: kinase/pyrophosphorylase [Firmicutes bacterium]|nr:kinase/pyrophosphorylase [Bacillota bacterium]